MSKVNTTVLLGNLGTNIQHCKLSQINYFWYCNGIDNVTLRLWKFSDLCSRHIVGVAGDGIMFHILVAYVMGFYGNIRLSYHLPRTLFRPRFRLVLGHLSAIPWVQADRKLLHSYYIWTHVMRLILRNKIFNTNLMKTIRFVTTYQIHMHSKDAAFRVTLY